MAAISKYFSYVLVFLMTTLIFMILLFSIRYETNVIEIKDNRECLILTNLFTGNSCYIAGYRGCRNYYENLIECD